MGLKINLAKIAYEAFNAQAITITRGSVTPFEELPSTLQSAWATAAEAVKAEIIRPIPASESEGPDDPEYGPLL
jgi:hypothetical protein